MMLAVLAESALRCLILGSVVWIGLNLLRVRNPHVHMTSWVLVLVASLSMPLLMHWTTVSVTLDALPVAMPETLGPNGNPATDASTGPLLEPLRSSQPSDPGMPTAVRAASHAAVNWLAVATAVYAFVAGLLLLRLAVGIYLTWRLVRAARPMSEPWTADWSVRVSNVIAGPVTFGSTILLPPQCSDWDVVKRQAVLAHEGAHVANRDFYVLLLASLNRAVFWFNPFAWWQLIRLAELAEIISDATALEALEDRLSYAEILLDLVQHGRPAPAGLEMARACTVRARVERILAATAEPARPGWRKRIGTLVAILPVIVVSAGSITYTTRPLAPPALDRAEDTARLPQHLSFYSLDRASIFTVSREGGELYGQLSGQRKLRLAAAGDGIYAYPVVAGRITLAVSGDQQPSELTLSRNNGHDMRAARIAELSPQGIEAAARQLDAYVGWYQLALGRVLTVTREGERLFVQETGRPKFEVSARGTDAFAGHDDLVIFLRDDQAKVTQLLLQDPSSGARLAPRVGASRANAIEADFARRIAEVPDRFRDQAPLPGSKEAILRGIEDLRHGTPNYDRMSGPLAAKIRRQASELQAMFQALGAVESIFFRGVGPGGYDFYGVKFANGFAEFRLLLAADGKTEDVLFRADGNEAPGGVAACSQEQDLRGRADTTPVHVLFYNATGADVQLYRLTPEGKRDAHATIGENTSSLVLTSVDSPWVFADASGKCLEIVLPGQHTRYHTIEAAADGQPVRAAARRTTPQAGSEEMLRQYIESVARGEPDYDRMTADVATFTRQQLPFNQAILSRLGALRAMSFRGVTGMNNDIYMAHFANGSAEWRIGLLKDGTIGRIALGPQ